MHRKATVKDLEFIYQLIIDGAKDGYFNRKLQVPEAAKGFKLELTSILTKQVRLNGKPAFATIYGYKKKPIGFIIQSTMSENKGNELWMAAIRPDYRGKGYGTKMLTWFLEQFKGKNLMLMARCSPESKIMYSFLLKNGFEYVETGKEGYRGLIYVL